MIELEPSFAEAHLCLAQAYTALGLAAEAEAALDEAATLRPEIAGWVEAQRASLSPPEGAGAAGGAEARGRGGERGAE